MSALKKAFEKIKPGGHHRRNSASSADEKTAAPSNGNASPRHSVSFPQEKAGEHNEPPQQPRKSTTFFKSPGSIKDKLFGDSGSSSDDDEGEDGEKLSKSQVKKLEKLEEKKQRRIQTEKRDKKIAQGKIDREEKLKLDETPEMRAKYGDLPVNNYAGEWKHEERLILTDISPKDVGREVTFRARVHNMRIMSTSLVFFVFRQQTITVQGVLHEHAGISAHFLYWAENCDLESVVLVKGIVQEPKAKQGQILGVAIHDWELSIHGLFVEGQIEQHLPFQPHNAEFSQTEASKEDERRQVVSGRARMANRILDLRTTASQSVFRVQSGVTRLFREFLDTQGFMEIHTPKLQGGATESGASVFKVDYFGRPAFLAQSPQLAKQMCISADFPKVYEVGAVFRAENSNTHRHMTEYTGLDLEMAIDEHYHEVLRMLDRTFKHIFTGIYQQYRHEIDIVKRRFPHEDLVWLEETPRIPFADGIRLLNETGWRDEEGKELPLDQDLSTRDEIQLGKVVKDKYKTDFYILDKFPVEARPFYAMPDPHDSNVTNSFDIFLRGQEILSGGQRIHDAKTLLKQLDKHKIDPITMEDYVQGFEWGAPPHGGGGIGLERMVMLLLATGDIRYATLFPRDPKSFPDRPPGTDLRHPEASTLHPPWEGSDRETAGCEFQTLENLIANYGDASNTSWLEPRTEVWRHKSTGAAVGFVPSDNYAIVVGDPLCHESQYPKTISAFVHYLKKERRLKPIWALAGAKVEHVLSEHFDWRSFSVAAEQRVDPSSNPAVQDKDIQKKVRKAEREGVKVADYPMGMEVPKDIQEKVDERVKDWRANRKGKQMHLTDIRLWDDMSHRQYHYATDGSGTACAIVVLAQLSPDHGWQIKWALDFPDSPSGAIEHTIIHALRNIAAKGSTNATFGVGASAGFTPGQNLKGTKVKVLSKTYHAIVTELKLTNKSEFRERLGAKDDPVYICYPPHGLGAMGVKAVLNWIEDEG